MTKMTFPSYDPVAATSGLRTLQNSVSLTLSPPIGLLQNILHMASFGEYVEATADAESSTLSTNDKTPFFHFTSLSQALCFPQKRCGVIQVLDIR